MKKILVCLTGVINRSIKYTWDSIKDNIIDELRKEYHVDIALFNNNVEDCRVDEVKFTQAIYTNLYSKEPYSVQRHFDQREKPLHLYNTIYTLNLPLKKTLNIDY